MIKLLQILVRYIRIRISSERTCRDSRIKVEHLIYSTNKIVWSIKLYKSIRVEHSLRKTKSSRSYRNSKRTGIVLLNWSNKNINSVKWESIYIQVSLILFNSLNCSSSNLFYVSFSKMSIHIIIVIIMVILSFTTKTLV